MEGKGPRRSCQHGADALRHFAAHERAISLGAVAEREIVAAGCMPRVLWCARADISLPRLVDRDDHPLRVEEGDMRGQRIEDSGLSGGLCVAQSLLSWTQ